MATTSTTATAIVEDGALRVPVAKDTVKDSPDVSGDYVDEAEARRLYDHYGLEPTPVAPRGDHDGPTTEEEAVVRREPVHRDASAGELVEKVVEAKERVEVDDETEPD